MGPSLHPPPCTLLSVWSSRTSPAILPTLEPPSCTLLSAWSPRTSPASTKFWGKEQGPTVFLWESLDEGGREECERAIRYWMGTEIGQLGGYGFQGVTLGVDGSCKDGRMGSECYKFGEKGEGKCVRVGRENEGTSSNRPGWEGWY